MIEEVPLLEIGTRPRRLAGALNSPKNPAKIGQDKLETVEFQLINKKVDNQQPKPLQTEGPQKISLQSAQDENLQKINEIPTEINLPKPDQKVPQIRVADVPKTISVKPPVPNQDELEVY